MFYKVQIEDIVRVDPKDLKYEPEDAIFKTLQEILPGKVNKEYGILISVLSIDEIGEGLMIPEDGGVYYKTKYTVLTFKPELNEICLGYVKHIVDYGAFIDLGVIDALNHISQIMDDEIAVSSSNALVGKKTKLSLKKDDIVRCRIISISYRSKDTIKIATTMRQVALGKLDWIYKKKEDKK